MPGPSDHQRATLATTNPYEAPANRMSEYTAQEIATLQSRLDRQLGPEYISTRPGNGGGKVHYLAAEKVINLANEVFGFNGWSSQIQNVQIDFCDESQTSGKISLGLSIIMRVTLRDGTFHEDIGYGHIENCKGKAAAFEKAKKEAATDALKRALRNFGNVLGNCLYDKEYLARVTKVKVAPSRWDAENLHRHHDFAPIKRESIADPDHEERMSLPLGDHATSIGGIELEDEFGGNLFDEVDLPEARPDEVVLQDFGDLEKFGGRGHENSARTGPPQTNRGPQVRRSVSNPMPPPPHPQSRQPLRPQEPRQVARGEIQPLPAQSTREHLAERPHQPQQMSNAAQIKPANQTASHDILDESHRLADQFSTPPLQQGGPIEQTSAPDSLEHRPTGDPPIGFVTSRHAEMLIKQEAPPILPTNIRFNPNAESPSIRKTVGFDHATSKPVVKTDVSKAVPQIVAGSVPVPTTNAGGPNVSGRQTTNFVNPADNVGRRVGMPGGGVGSPHGLGRATAYKPPSVVGGKRLYAEVVGASGENAAIRPPLADLSNIHQHPPLAPNGPKVVVSDIDGDQAKRVKTAEA